MPLFRTLIATALVVCAIGDVSVGAQQQPVFRGTGETVRVFVTVTDRDGRLVTTLTQPDFEVRDNGKPQPITLFDNTPQPIRLIVMLDVSGSMDGNLPLLRAAADQLITRLQPDDAARLGTFGHDVSISPTFTLDAGQLRTALPEAIAPDAPTPLWRALDEAMTAFGEARDDARRRVVLVLSDGKDGGGFGFRQRYVSQVEVIERARDEDVMIYAIGLRSRRGGMGGSLSDMMAADLPDAGLARVAEETGGGYTEIRLGQDLAASFAAVVDELHSQYLIGFAPPQRDGKTHKVDVRLKTGGLEARGRKSYVAPKK
ncbi:MAG: VWA domain-containing protein [Acidobacteria bacterium]|jgi:Ca-activated chloride channel family protein|nr:VWA domain-containing protein [Acidobacteriota bacterium]